MLIPNGLLISVVKSKPFFQLELLILHEARPEWHCLMQCERDWGCGKMCVAYLISSPTCTICERCLTHLVWATSVCGSSICVFFFCVCVHVCSQAVSLWSLVGLHRYSQQRKTCELLLSRLMFAWLIWMCECLYERGIQGHSSLLSTILIKPDFPQRLYRQLS